MEVRMRQPFRQLLFVLTGFALAACSSQGREPVVDLHSGQDYAGQLEVAEPEVSALDIDEADSPAVDTGTPDVPTADVMAPDIHDPTDIVDQDVPAEIPSGCCLNDEHCLVGDDIVWVCSWNEMSGQWGRCMSLFDDVWCWDTGDCPEGESCQGAFYCPCDAPCGAPDVPGKCMTPEELGDVGDPCGPDGGPCQEGLACCYPCGIQGCIFECTVPCDDDEPGCEGGCYMYA
jgi:hypothetical protein